MSYTNNQTNPLATKYNLAYCRLLDAAVHDLEVGVPIEKSGVLSAQELSLTEWDLKYLTGKGLVRHRGENAIQLTFDTSKTRRTLSQFEIKFKQIDYFKDSHGLIEEDESRVATFDCITNHVIEQIHVKPEIAPGLMALGIHEMFDTSEMAVPLERVLVEGLSPQAWFRESTKAIPSLTLDICSKYKPLEEVLKSLDRVRESGIAEEIPPFSQRGDSRVVKRVLQADVIINALTPDDVKLLGIYWFFARKMREEVILPLYEDTSVILMSRIQSMLEDRLEINMTEGLQHIEGAIVRLNASGITWASNIVRIPEVI